MQRVRNAACILTRPEQLQAALVVVVVVGLVCIDERKVKGANIAISRDECVERLNCRGNPQLCTRGITAMSGQWPPRSVNHVKLPILSSTPAAFQKGLPTDAHSSLTSRA